MSKRIVLFSKPSTSVFERLKEALFPEFLTDKKFAYMPSDGSDTQTNDKYNPLWEDFAKSNGAEFIFIDNSKRGEEAVGECQKLLDCNILVITGGNTYKLLHHLRQSGLGEVVNEMWKKEGVVLSGFSAGAIVMSPSIATAKSGIADANELGITDLSGLGIVDFEVWPHYEPSQETEVSEYRSRSQNKLKTIGDDEIVVIES